MSYDHYESYAETSHSAAEKTTQQRSLLQVADIVLAVGPLLRDSARDLVNNSKAVHMLVPGLAEIDAQEPPTTFTAFLSGRLTDDATRIKQGHLGIAAFATAQREARDDGRPDNLRKQPKLLLRGVDIEGETRGAGDTDNIEGKLKTFAEEYAHAVVNLHTLPFTENRDQLQAELSRSTVCLMPSWHEGFGLAAWEAIAAGVPLIISRNSGVYRLLDEEHPGAGTGCVHAIEVDGSNQHPFFTDGDLKAVVVALKSIADDPNKARTQAATLRNMLIGKTWPECAEHAAKAFGWKLEKGSVPVSTPESVASVSIQLPSVAPDQSGTLRIPKRQWQARRGIADSQLLRAEEALLDFDSARQPDVDKLSEWLDSTWPVAVTLVTGAGGQGKTRLALEVCQQSERSGWYSGFLDSTIDPATIPAVWRSITESNRPVFIVLDYAETRPSLVLALVRAAIISPAKQRVRLLLLARDGGEWWDNLPSKDSQCEGLLSGYATTGPFTLAPLYEDKNDRRAAYQKAVAAFAKALGVKPPATDPDLDGVHFERPLYIQMAALLALYGEQPTTAQGLTRALLHHERRYWSALLSHFQWPNPERRAEQLLTLTTLAGGFPTPNAAQSYWKAAKSDVIPTADFNALFRELATLYPGTQGLQALRPDLLGEALVAQALLRPSGEALLDGVLNKDATHFVRRNALTVVARLSNHRADLWETIKEVLFRHLTHCYADVVAVSTETRSRLPELAELAFGQLPVPSKSQVSGLLEPLLVEESVELASLSCKVAEFLCHKSRQKLEAKPNDVNRMTEYARASNVYAVGLGRIGAYEQACEKAVTSVDTYNKLRAKGLTHLENDYAAALNNYANTLYQLNRNEEALHPAREGVEIRKKLAQKNSSRFEPSYATSLSNYAAHLSGAGQNEEALAHAGEALKIRERLAQENPSRFQPDFADSLSNYAAHLSSAGRSEESVESASHALEIRTRLAQELPDRHEPDYAMSLNNYGTELSAVGRVKEALEYIGKAAEIRTRLSQKNPTRFAEDLFTTICFANFLRWLYDEDKCVRSDATKVLALVPADRRNGVSLYSSFLAACETDAQSFREESFRAVLSRWAELSKADMLRAEPFLLSAAAWCAKFGEVDSDIEWRTAWQQYQRRTGGRIPEWMLKLGRSLDIDWPS